MIVSFSVSNFRSFSTEETFSLVASKRLSGSHENHAFPVPNSNEMVLKAGVIYGANGAGKSNLFKALEYLKVVALRPREKNSGTRRTPFRFGKTSDEISSFDIQFVAEGKLYRFGFKIDDRRITEEWLSQVMGGREKSIYERTTDDKGNVTIDAAGLRGKKVKALTTIGGPQNQSFLATILVTLNPEDINNDLKNVFRWLGQLILIEPDSIFSNLGNRLASDQDLLKFSGNFLKSSSTGVDHLDVVKTLITEDEIRNQFSSDVAESILEDIVDSEKGIKQYQIEEGLDIIIERTEKHQYFRITVRAAHQHHAGEIIPMELTEESDGTRRLLNLIPALYHLQMQKAVYFIDEIDRSMHPILVWKFLEFFLKSCDAGQRQIIVTTHESNLLDMDLLRRDEIWFAEKDSSASTRLYSLMDFKIRKDLEIRKHYLQGRFGAVPFLGNIDRLLPDKGSQE